MLTETHSNTERKSLMTSSLINANDKRILIADGNSILNRAFFAIRPLSNKDGLPTNAVWGFVSILLKHIEQVMPTHGVVAFDLPKPTFRHLKYDGYKAGRKPMADELRAQLPWAKKCAAALGFTVIEVEGYEADDVIGTTASLSEKSGAHSYVLTGDRDSLQLISDNTTVLLASNNDTIFFDRAKFNEVYGVEPEVFVDVKALMGDSSDNIPGVAGIGEKTALKLVSQCGGIENIFADVDSLDAAKGVKQKLKDGRDSAFMSRELALICREAPIGREFDELVFTPDNAAQLELFTELEFASLIKRLELNEVESKPEANFVTERITSDAAARLEAGTYAAEVFGGELYICRKDSGKVYITSLDEMSLGLLTNAANHIITSDSKKLHGIMDSLGIDGYIPNVFDLGLAAYVLDSNQSSYEPTKLCSSLLGVITEDNAECVFRGHELKEAIEKKLTDSERRLYEEVELPLSVVLCDMERTGFMIDRDGLAEYAKKLENTANVLAADIYEMAGCEFNLNSPKQLGEVLFEKLGLPATKKTKTGYSTNAEALEHLKGNPIVDELLEWRFLTKMKNTFADGLLDVADENGRVHTTFTQTVTATGRLSSLEPNLQNIPVRQPLGRELRRYFVAGDSDHVLIDADYSQIELRLLAEAAHDEIMINAFKNGDDIHTITASQVFGIPTELVTPEMRKRAKAVNFGIVYGIGDFSLAQDLGVPRWQAAEYIKSYLEKYSGVDAYLKGAVEKAKQDGYVTTMLGRRRYIPELTSSRAQLRAFGQRVAMNSPIQGTAADIIKLAMLGTARALKEAGLDARMILQVHDELIVEASRRDAEKAAEILRHEMENAFETEVPLTVELTIGDTWYND